jgi:hypothetical protein
LGDEIGQERPAVFAEEEDEQNYQDGYDETGDDFSGTWT